MNRQIIAQSLIDKFSFDTYLEIGVQRGKNFFKIRAQNRIAVDPEFKIGIVRRLKNMPAIFSDSLFEMTSDAFFSQKAPDVFRTKLIDVALIDGLHTYEQVMKDFQNCLKYLSKEGFILFHDCNPTTREAADYALSPEEMLEKYPGVKPVWNGDVWKAVLDINCNSDDIEIIVLDCDHGVGVARIKPGVHKTHEYSAEQIREMTYDDLDHNRDKFLNLKPVTFWDEYLRTI